MKTSKQVLPIFLFLIWSISFCQTVEQQKSIDKALKMRDSIMNTPQMKAIMKQADEMENKQESHNLISPIPKTTKSGKTH
jgi:hypothetical protein